MRQTLLTAENIEKHFATVKAVDRLSFHIREGEIFALLGPNGAGKTTMVRILLNIIQPDNGKIHFTMGNNSKPQPSEIGYLPEERGLYQDIPVLKTLTYFGIIRGIDRKQAEHSAMHWLERLNLKDRINEKVQALSKGNQQKVQFIASILHAPAFAVLDEPFSGLDPINQNLFLEIIKELRANGTTVLLSAHQMQLVERIADRILLMNNGHEVLSGTLDEVRAQSGAGNKLMIQLNGEPDVSKIASHSSVKGIEQENGSRYLIYINPDAGYSGLLKMLGTHYDVLSIHSEHMSLHDIYIKAIGDGK